MKRRHFNLMALASAAGGLSALPAWAQAWPARAIRLIIPSTPGGGTDFTGRLLSTKLSELNGWSVVPDNRPGAGTALGLAEAARAKPDGYELVVAQSDNVSLIPLLMKTAYDPIKDLTPIALAAVTPLVILVHENSPFKTLADLIKAAKADPDKLTYGTSGTGGGVHIAMELLQITAGCKMQHVPYKGSSPALADLMGGHLSFAGSSISSAATLIHAGKVRALAVTSAKRNASLPEVPTVAEFGYKDFNAISFYGVMGPAGIPAPLVARLNADINKILVRPDVKTAFQAQGFDAAPGSPEEFAALIKADIQKSREIIAAARIKIE
ncbi:MULTISPECIES: tripartite tricarboxylate transporter substrate binding protein [unclassified Variovorax]|uniref:Bug family tripartite tricarboxylate transporter substrate binding protein n=1 Tax=unclassified Variovorax TaxID=663243 RepID=UPI002574A1E6|nr:MULTISPECIES: tripartite tricarboxylate transporter substrate binding protein [unclassified Variovorax]MDM0086888.1 tripartite tricarboxylate transporter substrate binding protein [Variovorax sp. J22G40]MDM0144856.1 tripartite tricarboxylate transporter substrate binding protein [Variovorax sp. J2P1-31]